MKVEIRKDACIYIIAESPTEAFAIQKVTAVGGTGSVVFDCSVLNDSESDKDMLSSGSSVEPTLLNES